MTLVLSLATPNFVLQVSDRRLTDTSGKTVDEKSNKSVLLANRMAFGYTGLARLGGQPTDEWLLDVLRGLPASYAIPDVHKLIADRGRLALAKINGAARWKRLAFVGVGWNCCQHDKRFYPVLLRISNFHDKSSTILAEAQSTFRVQGVVYHPPARYWGWIDTGQELQQRERIELRRQLVKCSHKRTGPSPVVRLFATMVRRVSRRTPTVGRDLLVTMIPRTAAESDAVILMNPAHRCGVELYATTAEARQAAMRPGSHMQFAFIPEGSDRPVQYGPHLVCPGGVAAQGMVSEIMSAEAMDALIKKLMSDPRATTISAKTEFGRTT